MAQRTSSKRDKNAVEPRAACGSGPATVPALSSSETPERPRLVKRAARKMTQCQATRSDGRRCRKIVQRGRHLCEVHSRRADGDLDYHRRIGQLGNEANRKKIAERREQEKVNKCGPLTSVEEAKRLLGILVAEMRSAKAPPKDIAAVIGAYLNAHTLQRDEATIARIDAIYAHIEDLKLARRGTGMSGDWPAEKEEHAQLEN